MADSSWGKLRVTVTLQAAVLASLIACLSACSSQGNVSVATRDGGSDGATAPEPPCSRVPGGREPGVETWCVERVRGRVTDTGGAPLSQRTVTLCGAVCFGAVTAADGAFDVPVDAQIPEAGYALFVHGRPTHASLVLPFVRGPAVAEAGTLKVPLLTGDSAMVPVDGAPATTVESNGVVLRIAPDTSWQLSFEDETDAENGRRFRALIVRGADAPQDFLREVKNLPTRIATFAPFDAKPSKPVGLTLPQSELPPGTKVTFYAMGGVELARPNRGGLVVATAEGEVSADGRTVSTLEGQGLPILTWVAVAAAR
jgi:hypothetical protein